MKWLNLAAYGAKIHIQENREGNRAIIVQGGQEIRQQLRRLGFNENKKINGLFMRRNLRFSVDEFLKELPKATVIENVNVDQILRRPTIGSAPTNATNQPSSAGTFIGRNTMNGRVFIEKDGSRTIVHNNGWNSGVTNERTSDEYDPGLYLRGVDARNQTLCADALVNTIINEFKVDQDYYNRFVDAVFEDVDITDQEKHRRFSRLYSGAICRVLAKNSTLGLADDLKKARRVLARAPFDADGTFMPSTAVQMITQRLLGTGDDLEGRHIGVVNASPAALSHLSSAGMVKIFTNSRAETESAIRVARVAGVKTSICGDASEAFATDKQVIVVDRSLASESNHEGIEFSDRPDLYVILDALKARVNTGNSLIYFDGARDEKEQADIDRLREHIGARYAVEGTASLGGNLLGQKDPDARGYFISVGRQRPQTLASAPEAAMRVVEANTVQEFTDWGTTYVLTSRRKVLEYYRADLDEDEQPNKFQVDYQSASKLGMVTKMIPRNLEASTNLALSRVVEKNGDVDQFVASRQNISVEELDDRASPEQIDGVALSLDAWRRGRGVLIGDDTGVGKGRIQGMLMNAAAQQGRKILYVTERPINLNDIWRDVIDVKGDENIRPLFLSDGAYIEHPDTKEFIARGANAAQAKELLQDGWPAGYNAIFATYAQFNKEYDAEKAEDWSREGWLQQVFADNNDIVLVADEAQNLASTTSNTSKNFADPIRLADDIAFASATAIKKPSNMHPFARLLPEGVNMNELIDSAQKGKEAFQEMITTMLSMDGVYIRREHDLSKLRFNTIVSEVYEERNKELADQTAAVLSQMAIMSNDIKQELNRHRNDRGNIALEVTVNNGRRVKELQIGSQSFSSPLQNFYKVFIAALKVDQAVDTAIQERELGKKPVFVVEATLEAVLKDVIADSEMQDMPVEDINLRHVMHRMVEQMTTRKAKDQLGRVHIIDFKQENPELAENARLIHEMIDRLPAFPMSAMDVIKNRMADVGASVGEITGRRYVMEQGKLVERDPKENQAVKDMFNSGEIEGIIFNVAGATGIDLHAGFRALDQNRRSLHEVGALGDVVKRLQSYGRVNRHDQVVEPDINVYMTGLPAEVRQAAMLNKAITRMAAATTASSDTIHLIQDIPDLMNSIGDDVCVEYASQRPELVRRLGLTETEVKNIDDRNERAEEAGTADQIDRNRAANRLLSHLFVLPIEEQLRIQEDIITLYYAREKELYATGMHPEKADEISGTAVKVSSRLFEGMVDDIDIDRSAFFSPVYLEEWEITDNSDLLTSSDVEAEIESGYTDLGGRNLGHIGRYLEDNRERLAMTSANRFGGYVRMSQQDQQRVLQHNLDVIDKAAYFLTTVELGNAVRFTAGLREMEGIVTAVSPPGSYDTDYFGAYTISIAIPGQTALRQVSLDTMLKSGDLELTEGIHGPQGDTWLGEFDNIQAMGGHRYKINTFGGNLIQASLINQRMQAHEYRATRSKLVTEDGSRQTVFVIPDKFDMTAYQPARIYDANIIAPFFEINSKAWVKTHPTEHLAAGFTFTRNAEDDLYVVRAPLASSRIRGHWYDRIPYLANLVNQPDEDKKGYATGHINEGDALMLMRDLQAEGLGLFVRGEFRALVNDMQNYTPEHENDFNFEHSDLDGELATVGA